MTNQRITLEQIREAQQTIEGYILKTPSVKSPGLSNYLGAPVALKLETLQSSGCFKPRGIINKILSLSENERAAGLVTVSGGNHGLALASIAHAMGISATIIMPETAPARSIGLVRANGANLLLAPDVTIAFAMAEQERAKGFTYIHAYDDPLIIAGHGTLGLEFLADMPDLTDVLVSIGGGALISGVATALKALKPGIRIWGVETVGADAMSQALSADHPVPIHVSSLVSTLGAPRVTERTLEHVKALVEQVFVVSDAEAIRGVQIIAEEAKCWVEPAAGCLVPAARKVIEQVGPECVIGLVLCGGNATFSDIMKWAEQSGLVI
jgi:threonine dehydratase